MESEQQNIDTAPSAHTSFRNQASGLWDRSKGPLLIALVNISRVIVSVTFILSGFVKAVDPIGTQYKIHDYADALGMAEKLPDWVTLGAAVGLAGIEFWMGMLLLFAMNRRLVTKLITAFTVVMLCVTVWIYSDNPVSDCGCFGDAIKLTNGQTLAKNIVLSLLAAILVKWPLMMPRMVGRSNQWIVRRYSALFILGISLYSLYYLPVFDFRPYHIGANIKEGMEIPEGAEAPVFETIFVMQKNGEKREFTLENYPDSTWTFVDSKTTVLKKGYEPPIHDFSIQLAALPPRTAAAMQSGDLREEQWHGAYVGDDITDVILADTGYVFLLVSPHLEQANDSYFGEIDRLYEYAEEHEYPFICLTASVGEGIRRWCDVTGAEYPICNTDETTLKTMIRSNPGLILLHGGTVVGKWSHNDLPQGVQDAVVDHKDIVEERIGYILMWFVLPLVLLVIADRLWTWSRWLKRKK